MLISVACPANALTSRDIAIPEEEKSSDAVVSSEAKVRISEIESANSIISSKVKDSDNANNADNSDNFDNADNKEDNAKIRLWLNKNVAGTGKSGKGSKNNGNVGEAKVIDGYLRSAIINRPDHIEVSLTPDGERMRYLNEDVDSLLLEGTDKYVKRLVKVPGPFGGSAKVEWVREEYIGKGIALYSLFTVDSEKINNVTRISANQGWYLSIADDVALMVSSSLFGSIFDRNEPPMAKLSLADYFGKTYNYPEFAARIKSGEFHSFMDVVHTWETLYAGTANRTEGKLKTEQIGVQSGIASADAEKNVDWKRTKAEIVFPKYTKTISVGASPVIAPWSRIMKHASDGDKSSFKMSVPPIMVYSDICFLDFGRFGSLGWAIGGEYSRYGYNWMWDNGYGDKQQDTFCDRIDLAAGLSYHITLCRNLELYARAMIDAALIIEHTTDHESGEKASTAFNKMGAKMSFVAVGGLRWYFCRSVGLYVEGGYDTGYAAAGLSFKF